MGFFEAWKCFIWCGVKFLWRICLSVALSILSGVPTNVEAETSRMVAAVPSAESAGGHR
jgi:hypothetical protein